LWQSFVQWFSSIIEYMYEMTGILGFPNYGLAIILLTIVIKIVFLPLTHKQMKSMRIMQEIQPKVKYIQEKYKHDQQKMQEKILEIYKQHGTSPFSGCLPLLIQMPIFLAFYRSLYGFEFRVQEHAAFLWIPNIGSSDPYYIIAVLAGLTTFLQQKVSMVNANDPTQKTMLYMMPLFMVWIAASVPAGLPLYWVVFNLLGIIQQLYINWSSNKAKLDTGTGIQIEAPPENRQDDVHSREASAEENEARRGKGGKEYNGSQRSRKKRKER